MKSIYDQYPTREELLEAASRAVREETDASGQRVFRLSDPAREKLQAHVESLTREARLRAEAETRIAALEAELGPLREENAAYKARETQAKIETQLVAAARKARCVETALRDVKRLASNFRLDESGAARTEDGRSVDEALQEELALSPHWLDRSQGANANEGSAAYYASDRERFERALRENDLEGAIRYAPRERS